MTPEQRAREIINLVDSVGVGRDCMTLWNCNLHTAIAQALREKDELIAEMKKALEHTQSIAHTDRAAMVLAKVKTSEPMFIIKAGDPLRQKVKEARAALKELESLE